MLRILFYFMMGWTRDAYYRFVFYLGNRKEDIIYEYCRDLRETGDYSDPNHEIILKWYPIDVWDLKKSIQQMEWRIGFDESDVKRVRECGGKEYETKYVRIPAEYFDCISKMVFCITIEDPARNIRDANGPYYLQGSGRLRSRCVMEDLYDEDTNTFNERFLEDKYMEFKDFDYVASCTGDDMFHFSDKGVSETLTTFVKEFASEVFRKRTFDATLDVVGFVGTLGVGLLFLTLEGERRGRGRGRGSGREVAPSNSECSIS